MNSGKHTYHFFVGDKRYDTDKSSLTGAQIKAMAGAESGDGLLLEGHGNHPDEVIEDGQVVDIHPGEGGVKRFRLEPAATFGVQ